MSLQGDKSIPVTSAHPAAQNPSHLYLKTLAMDEGGDDFLRLLGPPPYQVKERRLKRIFANYKPRDITYGPHILTPQWIERAGRNSRLYNLFWKNVPLIVPAETSQISPGKIIGVGPDVPKDFRCLTPFELAWENLDKFIKRHFPHPRKNRLADEMIIICEIPLYWGFEQTIGLMQESLPRIDQDSLWDLLDVFERLHCQHHSKRLTPLFIWKDDRDNKIWSKDPNTKRNIRPELGISQPMHAILNEALELWGKFLTGKIEITMDKETFQDRLCLRIRARIEDLYACEDETRGYMKYWMTNAFDAFSRPGVEMDGDMLSWLSLCEGNMIQPRPDLIKPFVNDLAPDFGYGVKNGRADETEMDGEVEEARGEDGDISEAEDHTITMHIDISDILRDGELDGHESADMEE
jgi:hypothetical protein